MAGAFGRSPRDLIRELRKAAPRFRFFQGARLLALAARYRGGKLSGRLPARLRFRTVASFAFPASEVTDYRPADEGSSGHEAACDEMTVAFMGLTGPSAALPRPYTELLLERRRDHRDTGAHAFFDIFSHRAIALFYGAWRKYRYWLDVESGERDGFTRNMLDLSGVGLQHLRERLGVGEMAGVEERLFAYYAGLLSQKPISGQTIVTVVQGFFGVAAKLEQFVGQWIEMPAEEQSRLGGHACELGMSAFSGERVWDRQGKIRLRLGPMPRREYEQLLPGQAGAEALRTLLHFMVGHGLACDVTLALERREVREPCLAESSPLLLGNTWLVDAPCARDPDDMSYRLLQ
jgi:type VI secretion system protein ImpH